VPLPFSFVDEFARAPGGQGARCRFRRDARGRTAVLRTQGCDGTDGRPAGMRTHESRVRQRRGLGAGQGRDADAAARIRKVSPHGLRHTHARKWVEASADRGILRARFGHVSSYPSVLDEPTAAVAGFPNYATPFRHTWSRAIDVFTNSKMMSTVIAQRMSGADGAVASDDSGIAEASTLKPVVESRRRRVAI